MQRTLIVLLLVVASWSPTATSALVRFYHGTDYDLAVKLFNDRDLTPYSVESYGALGYGGAEDPRTGHRTYTDFGKGLYTHPDNEALAVDWAKAISKAKGARQWGVVVFDVPQSLLDQAENPLLFEHKGSRPANAPVLPNSAGQPANWLEFIEHNRRIPYADIQKPRDVLWDAYDWIKGPLWVPSDSNLGGEKFPDSLHQVNWVRGLHVLNQVERILISGDVEADAFDVSGKWRLVWNWSVTTVSFIGYVEGGPTQWKFVGTVESGGNAIWKAAPNSANVTCNLTGKPDSAASSGKISCQTTAFPDTSNGWTGEADGTVQARSYDGKRKFDFKGRGHGTGSKGEPGGIDHLDLSPG